MFYYIIYLLLYPLMFILSFFRSSNNKNLVIQTAKIGDYVNSSIIFEPLQNLDIVIDEINTAFAFYDSRINNIYIINDYKINLYLKLKLAFKIFFNNYDNIYILMPNSFNLFLGQMSFAKKKVTLSIYANKWYTNILSLGMIKIKHTVEDLTLDSYLKLINKDYNYTLYKKKIQQPLQKPLSSEINSNKFCVGISLTAGNKLKTIDLDTWQETFSILSNFDIEIYIFGLENEQILLDNLLKNISTLKCKIISLLGKIELKYLSYEISKMNLYISSDTGNSYIADSMQVPLINFAGPCYMNEQKPVGEKSLIIQSHAPCVPFSFIFNAPYESKCDDLFKITVKQKNEINDFVTQLYKDFQS